MTHAEPESVSQEVSQAESQVPRGVSAGWRFWVPLALQLAVIAAVPAQAIYTHLTGRAIALQTAPVDPYDLLRGYSVTLSYDVSNIETLKRLPGWAAIPKQTGGVPASLYPEERTPIYVVLQMPAVPANQATNRPPAWQPIAVQRDRPTNLPANQIALRGRVHLGRVEYGVETYYLPETRRDQVNADIRQAQRQPGVMEVKLDAQGQAVPVSLWVGDRAYHF